MKISILLFGRLNLIERSLTISKQINDIPIIRVNELQTTHIKEPIPTLFEVLLLILSIILPRRIIFVDLNSFGGNLKIYGQIMDMCTLSRTRHTGIMFHISYILIPVHANPQAIGQSKNFLIDLFFFISVSHNLARFSQIQTIIHLRISQNCHFI